MDFFKSAPSTESLRVESEPPGAEAKTAAGQSCRTPCELTVQPGTDQSITLALNGYQPQTVSRCARKAGEHAGKLAPNPVFVELKTVGAGRRQEEEDRGKEAEADDHGRGCDADRDRLRGRAGAAPRRTCGGTGYRARTIPGRRPNAAR